jgi:hypothetical protein
VFQILHYFHVIFNILYSARNGNGNEKYGTLKINSKIDSSDRLGIGKQRNPLCQDGLSESKAVLQVVPVFSSYNAANISLNKNDLSPAKF